MVRFGKVTVISAVAGAVLLGLSGLTLASAAGRLAADNSASGTIPGPMQAVSYLGYQVQVPASWPVYRLSVHSSQCVLFNRHAVYLGTPGTAENCPVSAIGKTEALLVQPLGPMSSLPPGTSVQTGDTPNLPSGAVAAQDAASQEIRLALPRAGVQVTATYGHDPALAREILSSARVTADPAAAAQDAPASLPQNGPAAAAPDQASTSSPAASTSPSPTAKALPPVTPSASGPGTPAPATPSASASPMTAQPSAATASLTGMTGSGLGFDTCTVPSAGIMKSWLDSPFRIAGTYLGGDNWACGYGNFNRSWVSQVAAQGWRFIPIWVGPQAPCSAISGAVLINPSQAAAEGRSQAATAVSTAAGFGYGKGSPIYYDMEGYDNEISSCTRAVLDFLGGWTQALHHAGYESGVYSSASSGIADLASQYGKSSYPRPDDIWFGDWNGDPVVSDGYVPGGDWTGYRRLHQFDGPNVEKFGGVSVNIDDDFVAGAVAGLRPPSGPYLLSQPGAVTVAPGSAREAHLTISSPAGQPVTTSSVQWQVQVPSGLTVTPDNGSATPTPGQPVTFTLRIAASSSARQRRYNLPITASLGGQPLAGTSEFVSVARRGSTLSAPPVVLYAATSSDMRTAAGVARELALPPGDVTGSYATAWNDAARGKTILLAVGDAALNALYDNGCGWSNPAHRHKGSTPFIDLGGPLLQPPGVNYYENSAGGDPAQTAQLAASLTSYALTGSLPDAEAMPASPSIPGTACLGSSSIPVP